MGGVKWSPELQLARDTITYFALSISRRLNRKVGARLLIKLSKKVKYDAVNLTMEELQQKLNETPNFAISFR